MIKIDSLSNNSDSISPYSIVVKTDTLYIVI